MRARKDVYQVSSPVPFQRCLKGLQGDAKEAWTHITPTGFLFSDLCECLTESVPLSYCFSVPGLVSKVVEGDLS